MENGHSHRKSLSSCYMLTHVTKRTLRLWIKMCECGEYNGRAFVIKDKRREQELRRIEEEKRKGNDYDTFL